MVWEDLKPSDILTREAFENAIVVNSAIGGSTNAPIHLNAIAKHIGVELSIQDWQTTGLATPLLVNLQPAGRIPWRRLLPSRWSPCSRAGAHRRKPTTSPRRDDRQR
jgi:dihydroxyacid dehydratase/phosphogluconate dehydratase